MSVSIKTRQAYSEIDVNYIKQIEPNIPIKRQNLKEETLAIIALLNLQYWCKDEEEKKRLKAIYAQNEKEYQDMLSEKYNPNDIFKKNDKTITETNIKQEKNMQMIEYKEPIFKRIINGILRFFHIKIY